MTPTHHSCRSGGAGKAGERGCGLVKGAVPKEGRPYESPHPQANQRAVGRGLGEEAGLMLMGADRKFRGGCVTAAQQNGQ